MLVRDKIVVTGGTGRFGKILKKNVKKNFIFPTKKELNILELNKIIYYLQKKKPKYLIHLAGLSRPIIAHEKNVSLSIKLNIIGTSNIVIACKKLGIKLIYFSTSYVYPEKNGNHNEKSALLPINNYAWSKLGGECAVQMYKNSLILRVSMTEKPFVHKFAYTNMFTNFIYHEDFLKIFLKIINKKGIINVGGSISSVYNFVKKDNSKIKKKILLNNKIPRLPLNASMNIKKLLNIIK
jgi:dTDP-4-dehydrorhamnose reductase